MRPLIAALLLGAFAVPAAAQTQPHNVVLFVADGLRAGMVTKQNAPAMTALMAKGVRFANSHALFPTFTTANASGMATGHHLGDSGDFSNTIYTGVPVAAAHSSVTPFLENDTVLGEVDQHFGGDYLDEEEILRAARTAGYSTASVGKLGPVLIFDSTARDGRQTIIVDDSTGRPGGIPLSHEMAQRIAAAQLPAQAPARGANGNAGNNVKPGTTVANVAQQAWFTDVIAKAILPIFEKRQKPFVLVYWSRDPDGSQHNQGDSLGRLVPGINGPTSLAAIRNADDNLARLMASLEDQGLATTTDIVITSDHGFSTISRESATSWPARLSFPDVTAHQLPPGFVALDLAHGLGLPLHDPDKQNVEVAAGSHPSRGDALIGADPLHPDVVVAANGGSDLIYLPTLDKALAAKVVALLSAEDYVSGLFVDDALGTIPGTLPLSAISLKGSARTPTPSIVINFRSFTTGCTDPTTCGVEIADTVLQQGQGMHGSFSRADTRNVMGAVGPDFRRHFDDTAPASNADLGMTIAHLLGLEIPAKGRLMGRVLTEAMPNGSMPVVQKITLRSEPDAQGHRTVVVTQIANDSARYFDVAGYPGRTLGLPDPLAP